MTDQTELERLKAEMDAARKAAQVACDAERAAWEASYAARDAHAAWEAARKAEWEARGEK